MPNVSRHIVNRGWRAYRRHRTKLSEFDHGYMGYPEFLELEDVLFREWSLGRIDGELNLSDLGLSKLHIIANCSPDLHYILLKAAVLRHQK